MLDEIYEWIDSNSEVFNDILEEWTENKVVTKVANPQQDFKCNHCGKCCYTADIYALDISNWINNERYDLICSMLPMSDEDEKITFAFPNQKEFIDNIHDILDDNSAPPVVKAAFKRIEEIVKIVNPGFNPNSEFCLYYNPDKKEHCMIYEQRPVSCRTYPYDLPIFTDVKIPDNLTDKYGLTEDPQDIPVMCPIECFNKKSHKLPTDCTDDDLQNVLLDKVNFLANSIIEEPPDFDLMLEYFTRKLRIPKTEQSTQPQGKKTTSDKKSTQPGDKKMLSLSFSGEQLQKEEAARTVSKKSTKQTQQQKNPNNNQQLKKQTRN